MTINIADLRATLGLDTRPLARGVAEAKTQVGGLKGAFSGLGGTLAGLFAGAAIVKGFQSAIDATVKWGSEVKSLTRTLGISTTEASGLALAAEHFGLDVDQLNRGLGIFEKHLIANDKGFQSLGISARDSHGQLLPFNEILAKTSDVFAKLPDGPQKSALALNLFGRSGRQLIPLLSAGSAALAKFSDQAKSFGLELTGKNIEAITKFKFAQRDLGAAFKGIEVQLGEKIIPLLTSFERDVLIPLTADFSKIPAPVLAVAGAFGGLVIGIKLVSGVGRAVASAFGTVKGVFDGLRGTLASTTVATEEQAVAQTEAAATGTTVTGVSEALSAALGQAAGFAAALAESLGLVAEAAGATVATETAATVATEAQGAAALQAAIALQAQAAATLEAEAAQRGFLGGLVGSLGVALPLTVGLASLGAVLFALGKAHQEDAQHAQEFADALQQEAQGARGATTALIVHRLAQEGLLDDFRKLGINTSAIVGALTGNAKDVDLLKNAFEKLGFQGKLALAGIIKNLQDGKKEQNALNDALAQGGDDALGKLTDQFRNTAELNTVLSQLVARGVPQKIADQFKSMGADGLFAAQQLASGSQAEINAFVKLAQSAEPAVDAVGRLTQHFTDLTTATDHWKTTLGATLGATLNLQDVTARFDGDLASLNDSLKKNGHNFDLNTQKGRDNSSALRTVIGDIQDQVTALVQSGKVSGTDAAQKDALLGKLGALERKFPSLKTQIDAYITEVKKTPTEQATNFKAKFPTQAELHKQYQDAFGKAFIGPIAPDTKFNVTPKFTTHDMKVTATNVTVSNVKANMAGGFAPFGQLAIFGEEGPELGIPQPGGFNILNAARTRAALGARGGDGAPVTNNFAVTVNVSGATAADPHAIARVVREELSEEMAHQARLVRQARA